MKALALVPARYLNPFTCDLHLSLRKLYLACPPAPPKFPRFRLPFSGRA